MIFRILSLIIGYLIGCFQTAYILGKVIKKVDIRQLGSGNAGSTNVKRVFGLKLGICVFFIDILKTVIAYLLCAMIFKDNKLISGVYAGLGVIIGHDFPFYLKFRGGKGVASTVGLILITNWICAFISYCIAILTICISHTISLGSLLLVVLIPIILFFMQFPAEVVIIFLLITILTVYQHKENIKRLCNNTENKFF